MCLLLSCVSLFSFFEFCEANFKVPAALHYGEGREHEIVTALETHLKAVPMENRNSNFVSSQAGLSTVV